MRTAILLLLCWLPLQSSLAGQVTMGTWDFTGVDCFPGTFDGMEFSVEGGDGVTILDITYFDWGQYDILYEGGGMMLFVLDGCTLLEPIGAVFDVVAIDDIFNHYLPEVIVIDPEAPLTFCDFCPGEIYLPTTDFDFAYICMGDTGIWNLVISNIGNSNITIIDIVSDEAVFTTDFETSLIIPPDSSVTVVVTFAPVEAMTYSGTLSITSTDIDEETVLVTLQGEGLPEPFVCESFDHSGSIPPEWTIESHSATRTTPWSMQLDAGDDWSVFTEQVAYDSPFEEWLISPIYDLSYYQGAHLKFYHEYTHAASSALVKYSVNEGLSWSQLLSYSAVTGGVELLDISSWADRTDHLRFAFVFTGEFATGGASWVVDDFCLLGMPIAPTADTPVPTQPPVEWVDFTGTVGCTFHQPLQVDASTVEVRIDANADGDYDDGGAENWTAAPAETDLADLAVTATVTYLVNDDSLAFEFRARAVDSELWGYSGAYCISGIVDDWVVTTNVDLDPPVYTDAYPPLQPDPDWQGTGAEVGVTISDPHSGVDGSSIMIRVDMNQDNDYEDPGEEWHIALEIYDNANTILVRTPADYWGDGVYTVEYLAFDLYGNGPSYSMNGEGIADDILVKVDATPPTASVLYAQGAGVEDVTLQFSPSVEMFFDYYELQISDDEVFDGGDFIWGPAQDPALSEITTWQTTVTGLEISTWYWIRMRAFDQAGQVSDWSNTASIYTEGTELTPVYDLTATATTEGVLLSWPPVTSDIYGGTDIILEHYKVYSSYDFWFEPEEGSLIATTENCEYQIDLSRERELMAAYCVTAVGSGSGQPEAGMVLVPAGSFTMGPDPYGNGSAHPVSLTRRLWMDETEVTNSEYLIALQWAYDHALVTVDTVTVTAYGVELLDLDDEDCEIAFSPTTGQFTLMMRDHITQYGWGPGQAYPDGYDPAVHPVKEVTWYGAASYCDWRSEMNGLVSFYQGNWVLDATHNPYEAEGYRLPMEAEWEYAARYNDQRIFPWGDNFPIGCDLCNHSLCVGWTEPVGSHPDGASYLGLLDMAGNVVEFVGDWYGDEYNLTENVNPFGIPTGTNKVSRGADFGDAPIYYSQTVARQSSAIVNSTAWRGFRTVRPLARSAHSQVPDSFENWKSSSSAGSRRK
jgi:formylglycine-generating enzyme required for sulfatase activity